MARAIAVLESIAKRLKNSEPFKVLEERKGDKGQFYGKLLRGRPLARSVDSNRNALLSTFAARAACLLESFL